MVLSERWRVSDDELQSVVQSLQTAADHTPRHRQADAQSAGASSFCSPPRNLSRIPQLGLTAGPRKHGGLADWSSNRRTTISQQLSMTGGFTVGSSSTSLSPRLGDSTPRNTNRSPRIIADARQEAIQSGVYSRGLIRPDRLRREDTFPSHNGKAFNGSTCENIKVYVSLPSIQALLALWIHPDTPIKPAAPTAESTSSHSSKLAELMGPAAPLQATLGASGRASLLQSVIVEENAGPAEESSVRHPPISLEDPEGKGNTLVSLTPGRAHTLSPISSARLPQPHPPSSRPSPTGSKSTHLDGRCLQQMIEELTGISIGEQHLRLGSSRLDSLQKVDGDNEGGPSGPRTCRDACLIHGSTIMVNIGGIESYDTVKVQKHIMQQARTNSTGRDAWVMPRWEHTKAPKIFGQETEARLRSAVLFHDYTMLHDVGIIDPCDQLRRNFA